MQERSKQLSRLFTMLMQLTVEASFSMPGGRMAEKRIDDTLEYLDKHYGEVGLERIVDYCVCQVHRVSQFGEEYLPNWKLSHSFGETALVRFVTRKQGQKYYEDRWLDGFKLIREKLLGYIEDRSIHPLYRFIYPEYEEHTKCRALSSEVGYYICGVSTLLWTPFSAACRACTKSEACKARTQHIYPELYRIRVAEHEREEVCRG